jgi:cytoskeletal protein RodZ
MTLVDLAVLIFKEVGVIVTELGARLKEARVQKGYSLDDLQEITKIQKRYLVGIEEGNYASMPGSFYVRAFIKQYSEAVGLDPHEILKQYQNEIPASQVSEVSQSFSNSHNRRKLVNTTSSNKMMESVPKLIVGLFVVVILIIAITLISKKLNETPPIVQDGDNMSFEINKPAISTDPEEEDKEEDTEENKEDEEVEVVEPVQTLSPAVALPDGQSFEYTLSGVEEMLVRIEVISGPSWIGIRDSNGTEQLTVNDYKIGDEFEFDASTLDYIRIRLGRALNVKVFINDQEVLLNTEQLTQNIIIKKEVAAQ